MPGQLWAVNSLGGYLYSGDLTSELREVVQPKYRFRQFCDVRDKEARGKNKGEKWEWDVVFNVQTQGGTLVETNTMPETNFKIYQASGTITEYGNSVPYTGKLEALSKFSVRKPVTTALKNDMAKVLDSAAYDQFNLTPLRVEAASGTSTTAITLTTDSIAASSNSVGLNRTHVRLIHDTMEERNIPYYDGDNYIAVARPTTFSPLKTDLESVQQYVTEGYRNIMKGEMGKFENTRFVKQTNVASESWGNGTSDAVFFFGEETVGEGMAEPEHIRAKIPSDYGRSKGVAWYYLGGFAITHNWGDTGETNSRIVKWDSAG
jgi:N4-gp56 family major capsid protein